MDRRHVAKRRSDLTGNRTVCRELWSLDSVPNQGSQARPSGIYLLSEILLEKNVTPENWFLETVKRSAMIGLNRVTQGLYIDWP
jgi:hypothetical protein